MTAPDHMVEPLKIFLHVWGHPYMASGRGCGEDRRQEALDMACGGSGRPRARHPGAEPARQTGRQTLTAKAAEEAAAPTARPDHRQACQLWGREEGDRARRRAPAAQGLDTLLHGFGRNPVESGTCGD